MATIFTRGFMRRSLPALLALVLGLLVAPQPASSAFPSARTTTAAAVNATTHTPSAETVHSGYSTPAVPRPDEAAVPSTDPGEHFAQTLRTQVTASTLGSRAPPSALA